MSDVESMRGFGVLGFWGFGGNAVDESIETLLLVLARHVVRAPRVQRKGRIGDNAIVKDEVAVIIEQSRIADRVALLNPGITEPMQQ